MKAGDIWFDLRLEDGQFTARARGAEGTLRELRRNLSDTADSSKRLEQHFTSLSSGFRNMMLTLGSVRFALMDFRDIFLSLPLAIIKTSGEIERMTKLMEGLSTAADKVADANKGKNFIFEMAQNAPFEVKTLTDAFVKLKSGGIDPMDGSMEALVNSVAKFGGTSDQLHRASIAIQQMAGKGVVSMEELRQQLGEAVPNAINMMAIGVGKSMSELVKSISNGEVEAKSALKRMFAVMSVENFGAANAMMDTWTGMISQLQTKWELFKLELGGGKEGAGVFKEAREEVKSLLESFDSSVGRQFGADLSEAMYEIARAIRGVIEGVVQYYEEIKTFAQALVLLFGAKVITNAVGAAVSQIKVLRDAYRAQSAEFVAAERAKATAAAESAAADKRRSELAIVNMREELAVKQAQVVALNATYAEQTAFAAAAQKMADTRNHNGKIISNEHAVAARNLAQAHREHAAATAAAGNAVHAETQLLRQSIATHAALIAEKNALIGKNMQLAESATFAGQKMAGLGGIFNALGGWMTVLTGVIMGAVWAWDKFGNAAERNAERARRSANKMSTVEDLNAQRADVEERERFLKENAKLEKGARLDGAVYEQKVKELRESKEKLAMIEKNLADQAREDSLRMQKRSDEIEIDKRTSLLMKKKDEISRAYQEQISKLNDDTKLSEEARLKKTTELQKDYTNKLRDVGKDLNAEKITYYLKQNEDLRTKLKTASKEEAEKLTAIMRENDQQISDAIKTSNGIDLIGTPNVSLKSKKAGDGSSTAQISNGLLEYTTKIKAQLELVKTRWQNIVTDAKGFSALHDEARTEIEGLLSRGELDTKKGSKVLSKPQMKDLEEQINMLALKRMLEQGNRELPKLKAEAAALKEETANLLGSVENGTYASQKANREEHEIIKLINQIEQRVPGAIQELKPLRDTIDEITRGRANRKAAEASVNYASSTDKQFINIAYAKQTALAATEAERRQLQREKELEEIQTEFQKEYGLASANEEAKLQVLQRYQRLRAAVIERQAVEYKTPLQSLLIEWQDITKQMDAATARWGQSTIDEINKLVMTGKADFKSLVVSILSDISKLTLQRTLGGAITGMFEKFGNAVRGVMPVGATQQTGVQQQQDAAGGLGSLSKETGVLESAFETLRNNGIMGSIMSMTQQIFTTSAQSTTTALVTGELGFMSLILQGASTALIQFTTATMTAAATQTAKAAVPFANGGIMSSDGPLSLKKYARGGIADSPQLALFGEGSMREAFVPLPDGRSIPVTMTGPVGQGGGSTNVMIQINVQNDGSSTSTSSGDEKNAWRAMGERMKAVVQEEMIRQKRPGGILYSGK